MVMALLAALLSIQALAAQEVEVINLGRWSRGELGRIIAEASEITDTGRRIDFLSRQFLGVEYKKSTLKGDMNSPEVLVVNLEGVDCFTFIDYVEAMRLSRNFQEFRTNLKKVRYRDGKVTFRTRNHFFTDWRDFNRRYVEDATALVGGPGTRSVLKRLNIGKGGVPFLPGITPRKRLIRYIPSEAVDDRVMERLRTGDYLGIYTEREGLDVSHTGIVIRKGGKLYIRHASSSKKKRKVLDEDFAAYVSTTPGIIVLRPKE